MYIAIFVLVLFVGLLYLGNQNVKLSETEIKLENITTELKNIKEKIENIVANLEHSPKSYKGHVVKALKELL